MRRLTLFFAAMVILCPVTRATEEKVPFGRFGEVTLYYQSPRPAHVVLFFSGDGGWNLGVVDMARQLASLDALVVGVDIRHYLKQLAAANEKCSYPAGDLEMLSKFVQKKLAYAHYVAPVLVGYSSGATLVYATLVQAPSTTFLGAISLGFCPDLPLAKPMCRGSGLDWTPGPKGKGYIFSPAKELEAPWVVLQGETDRVCKPAATDEFVKQVAHGEIVMLPKVGHGYAVPRNWLPQFKEAFLHLTARKEEPAQLAQGGDLSGLPLIEVAAPDSGGDLMAVHITGDGGWGVTDRGLAESLSSHGIPVVALNALQYFWTARTPEGAAADLDRILRHYLAAWKKRRAIVIGYSLGADVLPFLLNRLPRETLARVQLVTFLGLSSRADFEFHLTDWLASSDRATSRPVRPEVEKLRGMKMLCFYGSDDDDALCKDLDPGLVKTTVLPTGHRIGKNFDPIAQSILREAGSGPLD